jgi:hypothetical protein
MRLPRRAGARSDAYRSITVIRTDDRELKELNTKFNSFNKKSTFVIQY